MAMGLIWVQEPLLSPDAASAARSPSAQWVPRGCSWLPSKGWGSQHPHCTGSQPRFCTSCCSFPLRDAPGSSGEHPSEQWGQSGARLCSEQGGRGGVLALHPSSCLVHPAKEGRDWDKPKKDTTGEGAEMELLKPTETQQSCNTSNTSLSTDLGQTQGLQGGRRNASQVFANAASASLQTIMAKNPPTRNTLPPHHDGSFISRCSAP